MYNYKKQLKLLASHRIGQIVYPTYLTNKLLLIKKDLKKNLLKQDLERLLKNFWEKGKFNNINNFNKLKNLKKNSNSNYDKLHEEFNLQQVQENNIIQFGERESLVYALVRNPLTYSAAFKILMELKFRLPEVDQFKSILDFGCGSGSASIACLETLKSISLVQGVDKSLDQLKLFQQFFEFYANVDFHLKRYLPLTKQKKPFPKILNALATPDTLYTPDPNKFDLTISSFVFEEIVEENMRLQYLKQLKDLSANTLVFIEKGTPGGFKLILEIRNFFLSLNEKKKEDNWFVVSPCTNDLTCPMETTRKKQWCHFSQRVQRNSIMMNLKNCKSNQEDIKYSYVVLKRGQRPLRSPNIEYDQMNLKAEELEESEVEEEHSVREEQETLFHENIQRSTSANENRYDVTRRNEASLNRNDEVNSLQTHYEGLEKNLNRNFIQHHLTMESKNDISQNREEAFHGQEAQGSSNTIYNSYPKSSAIYRDHNAINEELICDSFHWKRLVAPPLKNHAHVVLDVCSESGQLERFSIGKKSKQGLNGGYHDARKSYWGDLWFRKIKKSVTRNEFDLPNDSNSVKEEKSEENNKSRHSKDKNVRSSKHYNENFELLNFQESLSLSKEQILKDVTFKNINSKKG